MLYVSKGMVLRPSSKQLLYVTHCGTDHALTGIGAQLWLQGRFEICASHSVQEEQHLKKLQELRLVELSEETGLLATYYLLARCIIYPARLQPVRSLLTSIESQAWSWISKAGLRLSISELVKLFEDGVRPSSDLLGKENAQALTYRLYAKDPIFDTTLDIQMATARRRDEVLKAILGLLYKKRIILF